MVGKEAFKDLEICQYNNVYSYVVHTAINIIDAVLPSIPNYICSVKIVS